MATDVMTGLAHRMAGLRKWTRKAIYCIMIYGDTIMIKRMLEWILIGGLIRMVFRFGFFIIIAAILYATMSGHSPAQGFNGIVHGVERGVSGYQSGLNEGSPSGSRQSASAQGGVSGFIRNAGAALDPFGSRSATMPVQSIGGADGATVQAGFSPGDAEDLVVRAIDGAHHSIDIAAYSFTSKPIARALVDAARRGVRVRVVMDKSQETERYTSATFLIHAGTPVRIDDHYAIMHNKFLVIDDKTVETGSFNYTYSAAHRNAENVIVIRNDPGLAAVYDGEWHRLWSESHDYQHRASQHRSRGPWGG